MLLNINEVNELKKYYTSTDIDTDTDTDKTKVLGINIATFKIINAFLNEIKLSTKSDTIFRNQAFKNSESRLNKYDELYPMYINKIKDEDKLIFSKLINYITSEGYYGGSYSKECASNLPMHIDYKITYKDKTISGTYRKDSYYTESSLMYEMLKDMEKEFGIDRASNNIFEVTGSMKMKIYSSYDIEFNIENIDELKEQICSILNSKHFKNWKFKGERDSYEKEILAYIYGAKREVEYHKEKNIEVYNGINLDTCRYVACLMQFVKHGPFSRAKSLEEKTKLYNKIYPYILEMISDKDKEVFAKLSNFLTFENEEYTFSGYNDFLNSSKKEVLNRLELFAEVKAACEGNGKKKRKSKKNNIETKVNVHPFSYMFTGGSAIFKTKGWGITGQEVLKDILENKDFCSWKFSGLKTEEESTYKINYNDNLKLLNFSENSYYILGYLVGQINKEYSLDKKKSIKRKLKPIVMNFIPPKEQNVFEILLDYFTNQDEEGINVNREFVTMNIDIINKSTGRLAGRHYTRSKNKFSQIKSEDIVKEILDARYVTDDIEKINKDNVFDFVELRYYIDISVLSKDFNPYRERHYNKSEKFVIVKNILDSIEDLEMPKAQADNINTVNELEFGTIEEKEVITVPEDKEESKHSEEIEYKVEEFNLLDLLSAMPINDSIYEEEYPKEDECELSSINNESDKCSSKEDIEEPYIEIMEYSTTSKNASNELHLNGQLLFVI